MEKGGNSGNIGARKPILALGELLVDLVPGREGMRIEDAGPVVKTASGSAGIFACAVTLLGGRGGFIGKVGRDSLSRMVAGTLRGQGVDLSRLIVSDEGQMGLAVLEYLPEGRNYQYYRKNSVGNFCCGPVSWTRSTSAAPMRCISRHAAGVNGRNARYM